MCHNIFELAAGKMDCPIRLTPKCHPKAHVDVYVSARLRTIMVCCGHCDRPITIIHPQSHDDGGPKKNARKSK